MVLANFNGRHFHWQRFFSKFHKVALKWNYFQAIQSGSIVIFSQFIVVYIVYLYTYILEYVSDNIFIFIIYLAERGQQSISLNNVELCWKCNKFKLGTRCSSFSSKKKSKERSLHLQTLSQDFDANTHSHTHTQSQQRDKRILQEVQCHHYNFRAAVGQSYEISRH